MAFALDLVAGKTPGITGYKIDKPIVFDYDLKSADYPITESVFNSFRRFAEEKYKIAPAQIDREREFVERTLRMELVTAAYGSQTSFQVVNEYDDQLLHAIDLLPQAKQLALKSERAKSVHQKSKISGN